MKCPATVVGEANRSPKPVYFLNPSYPPILQVCSKRLLSNTNEYKITGERMNERSEPAANEAKVGGLERKPTLSTPSKSSGEGTSYGDRG